MKREQNFRELIEDHGEGEQAFTDYLKRKGGSGV